VAVTGALEGSMYYSGPEKDSFRVFPWLSDGISRRPGWFSFGAVGANVPMVSVKLLPRRPYLRLDADCQHFEDVRQVSMV